MTDEEFEAMKNERTENKRLIKGAGFKVCVVKRSYRLFDKHRTLIAEKPSYCGTFEIYKFFSEVVKADS